MNKTIDKQDLLNRLDFLAVTQDLIPGGTVKGKEYHHLCQFHDDHKIGNASTNAITGRGKCLSCGASWDTFKLYMHITSTTNFSEALQHIAERYTGEAAPAPRQAMTKPTPPAKDDNHVVVMPIPDDAPPPPAMTKGSLRWTYHDQAGAVLGYVDRFDPPGQRKVFVPLTLWKDATGQLVWAKKHFPEPRPLYGLDRLGKISTATGKAIPVLISEGEKSADAAHSLVGDDYACVSWSGGSNAAIPDERKSLATQGEFRWSFVKFGVQQVARRYVTMRQPVTIT